MSVVAKGNFCSTNDVVKNICIFRHLLDMSVYFSGRDIGIVVEGNFATHMMLQKTERYTRHTEEVMDRSRSIRWLKASISLYCTASRIGSLFANWNRRGAHLDIFLRKTRT